MLYLHILEFFQNFKVFYYFGKKIKDFFKITHKPPGAIGASIELFWVTCKSMEKGLSGPRGLKYQEMAIGLLAPRK